MENNCFMGFGPPLYLLLRSRWWYFRRVDKEMKLLFKV